MFLLGFDSLKCQLSRHIMLELLRGIRKMEEEQMSFQATMKKLWMHLILYYWYRKSQMCPNVEALMHLLPSRLKLKQLASILKQQIFFFKLICIYLYVYIQIKLFLQGKLKLWRKMSTGCQWTIKHLPNLFDRLLCRVMLGQGRSSLLHSPCIYSFTNLLHSHNMST